MNKLRKTLETAIKEHRHFEILIVSDVPPDVLLDYQKEKHMVSWDEAGTSATFLREGRIYQVRIIPPKQLGGLKDYLATFIIVEKRLIDRNSQWMREVVNPLLMAVETNVLLMV